MTQPRNPFEHHHDHGDHDHDLEVAEQLDPAQQSLADALRVSFGFLKVAMVILVVFYLFSGFFNVPSREVSVRLRFGDQLNHGCFGRRSGDDNNALHLDILCRLVISNTEIEQAGAIDYSHQAEVEVGATP